MKKLIAFFSIIALLCFEQSCQKIDTTDLGVGLIPPVDNVNTFDTTLQVFSTISYLSDSSNVSPTQAHALGVMEDPEFGRTSGSIFFEVLPPTAGVDPFGNSNDSIKGIDSVVLSLGYTTLYGDSTSVENFSVFEIAQSANFGDSAYRVNDPDFPVVATALGQKTVDFTTLNDIQQYRVGKDTALTTESNVLRIKLNKSLGDRLSQYDTSNAYKTDSTFRTFFKGLAIKADTLGPGNKKALAYFNISDNARTRLTVYYRITTNGLSDTSSVNFAYRPTESQKNPGYTASRSANLIRRNVTGTNYANNVSNPGANQQSLYIQSSPGSFATLNIPGLKGMSNRVIHQAQLIIQQLPSAEDNVFTPPVLFLDIIDSAKSNRIITVSNDFSVPDLAGSYNVADFGGTVKNNQFYFNVSRHIQGLVTLKQAVYRYRLYAPFETRPIYIQGTQESPLRLQVNSNIAAGRVVLAGGSHPTQKNEAENYLLKNLIGILSLRQI